MCLAVPVKVVEIVDEKKAIVELKGVRLDVIRKLVPDLSIGDYVLVHAGFIIEKMKEEDAMEKIKLYDEYFEKTGIKMV